MYRLEKKRVELEGSRLECFVMAGESGRMEVLRTFPYVIAIYDVDRDGDLDCVAAVRTEFIEEPLETTYVLFFEGLGKHQPFNLTYDIRPGPTPDKTHFTVGDDYDLVQEAHFDYTDYQNCVIMDYPFRGVQANHEPKPDDVNAFEALAALSHAVAMADTDDSGDLDCMLAVRKESSDDPPGFVYDTYMKSRNSDKK
ncbi:hypothetical protein HPB50_003716 [Hyalomma asiaticum]|uniref:Uncharacterized protein n=1 Tax=Hyalomma asiaticum TaxID=266040 RepID=A0ACB7SRF3_HYAAI|nr:hypothetical protein HPB50_003716 [Hyalomma asiaticum]